MRKMRDSEKTQKADDGWEDEREWPDPNPDPSLSTKMVDWSKRGTKSFLNLFGGYIFMAFAWILFFIVAFYFSFFLVGVNLLPGTSAGIATIMQVGAQAVMSNLRPMSTALTGYVGSVGIVMFAGGAISLWAYIKLKKLGGWAWKKVMGWISTTSGV